MLGLSELFGHSGKLISMFTTSVLGAGFLGSNAYYIKTLDEMNTLTGSYPVVYTQPRAIEYTVEDMDARELQDSRLTPVSVEINDALEVCEFWRDSARKNTDWNRKIVANEACVDAIIVMLKKHVGGEVGH